MTKRVNKNKNRKYLIIVFVLIIIIPLLFLGYAFYNSGEQKLLRLGYTREEASILVEKLNKNSINVLVRNGYLKDVFEIIDHSDFNKSNFSKYLNFFIKYSPDVTTEDTLMVVNLGFEKYGFSDFLVGLVNDDDFESTKIDNYFSYHESNVDASVEDVVLLVNLDIDKPYSTKLVGIARDKYFVNTRLDRYLEYASKNENFGFRTIVENVNSNLDYSFYTNIKNVDTSKGLLMLVNKYHILPTDFAYGTLVTMESGYTNVAGAQLSSVAYDAFKKLVDDASVSGYYIRNNSAYRNYGSQSYIYNSYVTTNGQVWADTWSARAGHSEHQTGLTLDVGVQGGSLSTFEGTKEFTWMKDNAHKYGFILRYPSAKEHITGYGYEPWHYRYVGIEVATYIYENKITFDEYYAYFVEK